MIETDIDPNVRINVSINGRSFLVSEGGLRLLRRGIIPDSLRFLGTSVREIEDRKFLVEDIDKNGKNDKQDDKNDKNDKNDDKNDKNDKIDKKEIVMTIAPKGYEDLYGVLMEALEQTANGKGKERHGNGKPFSEQPIMTIAAEHGVGFLTGQAAKKLGESHTLLNIKGCDAAVAELLGAIAYTAAAILHLRRTK